MSIDEQPTIRNILLELKQEGIKTADVAKKISGISEKPLRNALKLAGYAYRNSQPKGWYYIGEGEEPLDKNIFDYVKRGSSSKKSNSPTVTQSNIEVITDSPIVHQQFTNDEVRMIKDMLVEWQRVSMQGATQAYEEQLEVQQELNLHERIKQLPQNAKTRKTIVIDESIGKQLDEFCGAERVQKSDVLHLALIDFLEKYQKE